ncbi:MAG: cell division protein FtsB, partial [Zoogloeaceae bacterium]|nr:cell division protein FtsB [Zoogloeaceae bacterium]
MRWLTLALFFLVLLLQYPLWFGEGGWLKVWEYDQKLEQLKKENEEAKRRNAVLEAEARDLRTGYAAIEESARSELGMIRPGEVFIPFTGEDEEETE